MSQIYGGTHMDRQQQQRRRTSTWVENTLGAVCMGAFGFFFAWILINWLMGCGESFPQADGTRVMGECLSILPWRW